MKIVIDVPDEIYKKYIEDRTHVTDVLHAVRHGTPLPEHHGRLIDISEYEKYFNTAITYDDGNHVHVFYTNTIPTIIEGSDKE